MTVIYRGARDENENPHVIVTVTRNNVFTPLSPKPSLRVMNHSPCGFEWGYHGSGPAQLALAMLLDLYPERGNDWAARHHQAFKARVIGQLPREGWELTSEEIDRVVAEFDGRSDPQPEEDDIDF